MWLCKSKGFHIFLWECSLFHIISSTFRWTGKGEDPLTILLGSWQEYWFGHICVRYSKRKCNVASPLKDVLYSLNKKKSIFHALLHNHYLQVELLESVNILVIYIHLKSVSVVLFLHITWITVHLATSGEKVFKVLSFCHMYETPTLLMVWHRLLGEKIPPPPRNIKKSQCRTKRRIPSWHGTLGTFLCDVATVSYVYREDVTNKLGHVMEKGSYLSSTVCIIVLT